MSRIKSNRRCEHGIALFASSRCRNFQRPRQFTVPYAAGHDNFASFHRARARLYRECDALL